MEDFRKADPKYYGFVPKTAAEAIDLFFRLKRNGLSCEHHPEAFVWCARELPDPEGVKFEEWIVAPQGISPDAPVYTPDPATEKERARLAAEADARDAKLEQQRQQLQQQHDDEKHEQQHDDEKHEQQHDDEMVRPSER